MAFLGRISPAAKLAFSITLVVLSVLSISTLVGAFPDSQRARLEARARIAEAVTIQIAMIASQNDITLLENTIVAIQNRDKNINSIALKDTANETLAATPDHDVFWEGALPDKSSPTHVQVPIADGDKRWGKLEIAFSPIPGSLAVLGMTYEFLVFSGFAGASCFVALYFLLRVVLRQLDPTRSVPSRVKSAFDSLSDGIAVIDEKDNILLVNQSLANIIGEDEDSFMGKKLSNLLWRSLRKEDQITDFPWLVTLKKNITVRDVAMNLRSGSGSIVNVLVNASPISTGSGSVNGALISFKDVTVIERKNRDLSLAYTKLQQSESEIKEQNTQLQYLANHDPLTSCLNRRSLFEQFEQKYVAAVASGRPLMCLMIDVDHFKSVNDTYGHAVGDSVIVGLAQLLLKTARENDLVGRYGGEEFCMVLDGVDEDGAADVAEHLRKQVKELSGKWLGQADRKLSISLGIAPADREAGTVNNAVNNADQALYHAKETGRDRAVRWRADRFSKIEPDSVRSETRQVPDHAVRQEAPVQQGAATPIQAFTNHLQASIDAARNERKSVTVICVNFNGLEACSQLTGKENASAILGAIDERLNAIFRDSQTVSLMSGQERNARIVKIDEKRYLIELTDIGSSTSITWIMQRLSDKLSLPLHIGENHSPLQFSIGASLYPNDGDNAQELIANAMSAQAEADAQAGHHKIRMYSTDMFDISQEQHILEMGIIEAIKQNEFQLYFQPIVDLGSGGAAGAEVLLRSTNRHLQNKSIESVIQVAEKTGLINELSNYVFNKAFSTLNAWSHAGIRLGILSINLSAEQLKNNNVVMNLIECTTAHRIDPCTIQLELTETAMVADIGQSGEILQTLQNYGFFIALDDFGTGQSSLSHLLAISPDTIKIDKTFVQSMTDNHTNSILVSTIIDLSDKIGAKVVAEGVETPEQLQSLMESGCRFVQGYLLSRPLPEPVFREWLSMFNRSSNLDDAAEAERVSA